MVQPPDSLGGAGARAIAPDRLVGDKINALQLDSVLVRYPQIIWSERQTDDEFLCLEASLTSVETRIHISSMPQQRPQLQPPISAHDSPLPASLHVHFHQFLLCLSQPMHALSHPS